MKSIASKEEFRKLSPAASAIFDYLESNSEVCTKPWGFDRGGINNEGTNSWADFSCVSLSGRGKDELIIQAQNNTDDEWEIQHTIKLENK